VINQKVILGIFGGMGPEVTADFYRLVVRLTKAERDQDHIPTLIYSLPQVPERTKSIRSKESFDKELHLIHSRDINRRIWILWLENHLVKLHQPRFNVRLRDDKQYLALRLDTRETWPRLREVRRFARDGADYFGPYTSSASMKEAVSLANFAPSAALAQTSLTRPGSIPKPFKVRRIR